MSLKFWQLFRQVYMAKKEFGVEKKFLSQSVQVAGGGGGRQSILILLTFLF